MTKNTPVIPTQDRVKELFTFDEDTGFFTRIKSVVNNPKRRPLGSRAKGMNSYIYISIDGRTYAAHRVVWLWVHGQWPTLIIDHKNRDRADNRPGNLREATQSQNMANNPPRKRTKSGKRGVYPAARKGAWQASITADSVIYRLGTFDTIDEAHKAYCTAADKYHGEFANYG